MELIGAAIYILIHATWHIISETRRRRMRRDEV